MKKGSTLDALLQEGFTQIITGVQPIDYFDTLVEFVNCIVWWDENGEG